MTLTRSERDSFTSTTPIDIAYGEGACLETPKKVFELLNQKFKFDVDLTANETNALLPRWFGPRGMYPDACSAPWAAHHHPTELTRTSGFSNPPYGPFIPKILKKALEERDKGFTSVFLLPMRAGGWFQDLVIPYYSELWYCESRLMFGLGGKPRLTARVKATKKEKVWIADGATSIQVTKDGYLQAGVNAVERTYTIDGTSYTYQFAPWSDILAPAGALFDSIIVVFAPYARSKWGLFPPPQRPNVWNPRTGELRY